MQSVIQSPAYLKKRKFLLILPLLVLPFIVLLFFSMGGGQGIPVSEAAKTGGLNLQLPDAHFIKKREIDKLGLYDLASQDSAKWKEALKNDPYRMGDAGPVDSMSFERSQTLKDILDKSVSGLPEKGFEKFNPSLSKRGSEERENEIKDKLSRLQTIVNSKPRVSSPEFASVTASNPATEKLSGLVKEVNSGNSTDPELSRLERMLDKVMAIQHPETVQDSLHLSPGKKETVYRVETIGGDNAVSAIIPEKQTLISGATIRLQLTVPVTLGGIKIPSDQFIYGMAMLSNERLKIQVRSIRVENNILPVSLDIYDLDGMEGIYVPGSISRDVSKQSLDQSVSELGLTTLDPSFGAQAATAGIQAAKTLISRKVKQVQVTVPNDYQILLKNTQ